MEEADVWAALERGGAVQRGHFAESAGHADLRLAKYNGLLDPAGAEALAGALAEPLVDSGVSEGPLLASLASLKNHLADPAACPACRRGEPVIGGRGAAGGG